MEKESKLMLAKIFFEKLEKNSFDEITISEIASYADLSRSTFYRYFKNKKSIVEFFIQYLLDDYLLIVSDNSITDFISLLIVYFEFWNTNKRYLMLLKKHNLLDFALNVERKYFLNILPTMDLPWHNNGAEDELFADLMVMGGVWNVALYWLENDTKLNPTYIAKEIVRSLSLYKIFV
ncbi:TetR/AcrR family transcriptional regulator [Streptococcus orisasini]|uniref:TetR/AcrR family transcriptional regulator n=1 Tax=Streptococcus orisasini TaxID=1080071 RepID=UPI00070ACCAE|nr:TetR/AcrR family transcriptional regulator [Streptococcus orisasini]